MLRAAAVLVGLEGVALALSGAGYIVSGFVGHPEDRLGTVLAGLLAVLTAVALLAVGRALRRTRSWPWAPAVLAQLLLVVVAVGLLQGHVWPVGAPLLLVGITVMGLLATGPARQVYRAGR